MSYREYMGKNTGNKKQENKKESNKKGVSKKETSRKEIDKREKGKKENYKKENYKKESNKKESNKKAGNKKEYNKEYDKEDNYRRVKKKETNQKEYKKAYPFQEKHEKDRKKGDRQEKIQFQTPGMGCISGEKRREQGSAGKKQAGSGARESRNGICGDAGQGYGEKKSGKDMIKKGRALCRAFGECGGCQLLGIPYEEQLIQKEKEVQSLLKPYVRIQGIIGMEDPRYYRNKVNAAFTHDRQGLPLSGVYKEGTHYIIPIESCLLENQKADEIIGSIRSLLPSFKIKTYDEDTGYGLLRHVMVRVAEATGQIMVVLVLSTPVLPSKNNFVKALRKLHPEITTIVVNVNNKKTSMVLGDKEQVIYGKGYIEDQLCGLTFRISSKSFYQVNHKQTEKLYRKAIEFAGLTGRETVLDAYSGIGTIGMIAAERARRVISVELNKDAVRDAVINAKLNGIRNIEFYQKDAGDFMRQIAGQGEKIHTVFMDPPRSGSDEVFLDALAVLAPERIVYVSCNPETLARDLGYLQKKGYRGIKGACVDMFGYTSHVEVVTCLQRVNS